MFRALKSKGWKNNAMALGNCNSPSQLAPKGTELRVYSEKHRGAHSQGNKSSVPCIILGARAVHIMTWVVHRSPIHYSCLGCVSKMTYFKSDTSEFAKTAFNQKKNQKKTPPNLQKLPFHATLW